MCGEFDLFSSILYVYAYELSIQPQEVDEQWNIFNNMNLSFSTYKEILQNIP
jgi:hypothetical protein